MPSGHEVLLYEVRHIIVILHREEGHEYFLDEVPIRAVVLHCKKVQHLRRSRIGYYDRPDPSASQIYGTTQCHTKDWTNLFNL